MRFAASALVLGVLVLLISGGHGSPVSADNPSESGIEKKVAGCAQGDTACQYGLSVAARTEKIENGANEVGLDIAGVKAVNKGGLTNDFDDDDDDDDDDDRRRLTTSQKDRDDDDDDDDDDGKRRRRRRRCKNGRRRRCRGRGRKRRCRCRRRRRRGDDDDDDD